jgi:hypothetical protein
MKKLSLFASVRAFSGKVDTGFPKENATSIESRAFSATSLRDFRVNLNGKRSSAALVCAAVPASFGWSPANVTLFSVDTG